MNEALIKQQSAKLGYANLARFSSANRINRATLHNYLQGRGPISESFYDIASALKIDPLELLIPVSGGLLVAESDEIIPLIQALTKKDEGLTVGLLGSRAKRSNKRYSDWDLGVSRGAARLSGGDFLSLQRVTADLTENLPRAVDLMNLDAAPAWFLQGIDYEPIFLGGNETSWHYFLGVLHGTKKAA